MYLEKIQSIGMLATEFTAEAELAAVARRSESRRGAVWRGVARLRNSCAAAWSVKFNVTHSHILSHYSCTLRELDIYT